MIRYTFLGDGSSDRALMKVIDWTFSEKYPQVTISAQFGDFRHLLKPIKTLEDRINKAWELYPCDILFVHRDAENNKNFEEIYSKRKIEIQNATEKTGCKYVAVIPIKMMETWLLTDEIAIRKAAGNPHGKVPIGLPSISKLESWNDPKEKLHEFLRGASGLKGRRLDSFNVGQAVHLVAEYTDDFRPLRNLYAFREFEKELENAMDRLSGAIKNI